jgi:ketosteroid isomerase-like protein
MSQDQPSLKVIEHLVDAINRGDVDNALRVCSKDIVVTEPEGGVVTGAAAFRSRLEAMAGIHAHLQLTTPVVHGDTVRGIMLIANDYHRKVGVAPLELDWQAEVQDGTVHRFGGTFTAASLEKLRPLREGTVQ